jgi:CRP-like cAMP-binding protein
MSEDKEQYSSLIRQLVPINDLSDHLQVEVIGITTVTKFKKKQFIFKQGGKDSYSYYILNGEIELLANKTLHSTIVGGTDRARYALAQLQPRQFSAKTKTEAIILQVERAALDRLMVMVEKDDSDDTITGNSHMEVSELDSEESGDWMTTMLQSQLFSQLPMANIQKLFALLEEVEFAAGDSVIKQGDSGEHYYIIQEGRCEVTRAPSSGADPIKLAELKVGDSFGEEALLTDAKRNASINMLTNGVLMQLSKGNFIDLIKKPALVTLKYEEAKKQVAEGAIWLDVRFKNEHEDMNIEGSINIPLNVLRMQTDKLQVDKQYIVYCDTGGRSSAATFLLAQRGIKASYLDKGLVAVPELASKQETPKEGKPVEEKKPEAKKVEEEKEVDKSELEPAVRASVLKADIAKKEVELEETKEQPVASDDKEKQKEQKAAQEKLEKERKKLEAEKAEKKKLEEVYERNTKEMEKLQRMKQEAGEQIKKEREKLQKEAAAAQAKLEKAAAEKKAQQEVMEKQLQEKAKEKIEQERRKLAEEMAKSSDVLEQAKREKVAADAARKAAEEEAQKIIAEYKQEFDKERADEDVRIKEERKKLEEESKKIQDTLKEIQNAKQGAEVTQKAAEEQAEKLREQQKQEEKTQDSATKKALDKEIKEAEAKLAKARASLDNAEDAEHTIVEAREVNEEELRRQKEIEEEMRKHTAADLEDFMEEHKEKEKSKPKVVDAADHAKRIKASADDAKKTAEEATDDLFSDIASQLSDD